MTRKLRYESLEDRDLLTVILDLDTENRILHIADGARDSILILSSEPNNELSLLAIDTATETAERHTIPTTNFDTVQVYGGGGNDVINASAVDAAFGDINIFGEEGDDILTGHDGDNHIFGGEGDDTIVGHAGDDTASGDAGTNTVDLGEGVDAIVAAGSRVYIEPGNVSTETESTSFDDNIDFALLDGTTGDDRIIASASPFFVNADLGDGDDIFIGSRFSDTVKGGPGH